MKIKKETKGSPAAGSMMRKGGVTAKLAGAIVITIVISNGINYISRKLNPTI